MKRKLPIFISVISLITPINFLLYGIHFGKIGKPIIPEKWFLYERIGLYLISAYLIGVSFYLKNIAFSKIENHLRNRGLNPTEFFIKTGIPIAMVPSGLAWILFLVGNISFDFYFISSVSFLTVAFWCIQFRSTIIGKRFS